MKTIAAPRRQAFFYPRPVLLDPVADGRLVALQGATRGLLRTPAQLMQQPSDMIDVIAHAEAALDQLRHPRAGPQIGVKARRLGTLHEQPLEPCSLFGLELGRTPGSGLGPYPGFTLGARGRLPTAHAAPIGADAPGDLHRLESLLEQRQRAQSPTLQFLWGSRRSHCAPPGPSVGHYLRRRQ
jgi:hypothetical protein